MPWVKFTADFDFKPKAAVTIAYLAGQVRNVTRACAERSIAKGKAVPMMKTSRDSEPVEVADAGRR